MVRNLVGAEPGALSWTIDRTPQRHLFYGPDVPDPVVAADSAAASRLPALASAETLTAGFAAKYAAAIDVPVFLGLGGLVDLAPDPRAEFANYPNATDVTLYVVEGSAHCHNLSTNRAALWDRIAGWIPGVVPVAGSQN